MSWIKLDDRAPWHPKVAGLSDRAFRWWLRGLCYASQYLTDGELPAAFAQDVPARVRKELVDARLWTQQSGGCLAIHGYLEHQSSRADVDRERARNRQRRTAGVPPVQPRYAQGRPSEAPPPEAPDRVQMPEGRPQTHTPRASLVDRSKALGIVRPGAWDRQHASHALRGDFCDWVCLPVAVHAEFVNRVVTAGSALADAEASVRAWALDVKNRWAGRIPGEDCFKFWRAEWAATHPSHRPAATPAPGAGLDALIAASMPR